jgi:GTP-binding protein
VAGHSNSGKSTLVNVLAGYDSRKGPAKTSDRAGWTDQICFYQLGKRPPVLVLADLPGYGHAIADAAAKREWQNMTRDYLGNRIVLSRCCVLVDCSRGLCRLDHSILSFLTKVSER